MTEILTYLPLLGIAMICNILVGLFYSINIKNIKFDWIILVNGIIKAIIIASVFIGLSYIFDSLKELAEAIGVTPKFVLISAITLYTSKAIVGLSKILGVTAKVKE